MACVPRTPKGDVIVQNCGPKRNCAVREQQSTGNAVEKEYVGWVIAAESMVGLGGEKNGRE